MKIDKSKLYSALLESLLFFIGISAAVLIFIVLAAYFESFDGVLEKDTEKWGQFGDYLGGTLNPLLSFFTIAILIITTRLQKQELREAQAGIAASNQALSKQCDILAQQSYEQTFFRLFEDFKNDPFVIKCCSKDADIRVSVYKIWRERNNKEYTTRDAFRGGIPSGAFVQVFLAKLDLMLTVIQTLNHPIIYIKLVQAHIGPILTAAICQYAYMKSPRAYSNLRKAKDLTAGIAIWNFYIKQVVADFDPDNLKVFEEQFDKTKSFLEEQLVRTEKEEAEQG